MRGVKSTASPVASSLWPATWGSTGQVILLGGICLLPVVLYLPFLNEPLLRDEGFYASVAQSILDGGVPYRDAFDNKPPLIFGWYALSFLMFGEEVWAPRLLVAGLLSITSLLVYVEGRLLFSHRIGLMASAVFGLSIGVAAFGTNANTEYFMLLPMVGALVSFTAGHQSGNLGFTLLAGFLAGLAVMTKETSIFCLALLPLLIAVPQIRSDGFRVIRDAKLWRMLAALFAGAVAAGLVVASPFVITGSLGDFFQSVVLYAALYVGEGSLGDKLWALAGAPVYLMTVAGPLVLLSIAGVAYLYRTNSSAAPLLIGWAVASVAGIIVVGRFYAHYYVILLPAMALLVPVGVTQLRELRTSALKTCLVSLVLPLSLFLPILINGAIYVQPDHDARYLAKFRGVAAVEFHVDSPSLAAYLAEHTGKGDFIYNLGFQSELYFYANRPSPTRFLFDHPFAVNHDFELEAVADLENNKPLYIVDSARYEPETDTLDYYPIEIKRFVDRHYEYLGKLYYADIYRLLDGEPYESDCAACER